MLMGIYLATTAISCGVFYLSGKAYGGYLERNNYVSTTKPKGASEILFDTISLGFKAFIPGYNLYTAVILLWTGSKNFEELASKSLNDGSIRKLTEEEIEEKERQEMEANMELESSDDVEENFDLLEETNDKEETNGIEDEYDFNVSDDNSKSHMMSLEEKIAYLEREKELLISIKKARNNNPKQFKLGQK